jgi:hypothetical protein
MATLGQYDASTMTAQEVFNAGRDHLLQQNAKSERKCNEHSVIAFCVYNGEDGKCCGAAPFLLNYVEEMEGDTWDRLSYQDLVPTAHKELILALQDVHDVYDVEQWAELLTQLAEFRNLTP